MVAIFELDSHTFEDGGARIGATLFGELLNATFASVGHWHAVRKVARETFDHLLNLDLKFHLSRHAGGLTRALGNSPWYEVSTLHRRPCACESDVCTEGSCLFYQLYYSE